MVWIVLHGMDQTQKFLQVAQKHFVELLQNFKQWNFYTLTFSVNEKLAQILSQNCFKVVSVYAIVGLLYIQFKNKSKPFILLKKKIDAKHTIYMFIKN